MTEATKTNPSPLDAFDTAKPDEPIWTVQGGDPLGAPLLRIWALFARIQAGRIPEQEVNYVFEQIRGAASNNPPKNTKAGNELLIRATETEQISWSMDEYRKGQVSEEQVQVKRIDDFERMDIFDVRRKTAERISAFFSELNDLREELLKREWLTWKLDVEIQTEIDHLRKLMEKLDVKRK